jgi:hypothetical protein
MSVYPTSSLRSGSLGRDHWDVPIRVRLLTYVEFTRWLDGELEKLVARWAGQAAPAARRRQRREA